MKRSITVAFWVLLGLLAITAVLAIATFKYGAVCFWAALFAALGQTVLAALAWWGLRLARQQAALVDEAEAEANVKFTPPAVQTAVAPSGYPVDARFAIFPAA